jgi:hypothetical protein
MEKKSAINSRPKFGRQCDRNLQSTGIEGREIKLRVQGLNGIVSQMWTDL